jgi:hypothetical protein
MKLKPQGTHFATQYAERSIHVHFFPYFSGLSVSRNRNYRIDCARLGPVSFVPLKSDVDALLKRFDTSIVFFGGEGSLEVYLRL